MAMHNFEELEVWKRSSRLAVSILGAVDSIKLFSLRDQMARACTSIPSNIAEGAERDSNKEFRRFLAIAKGSAGELRTQLYLAQKSGHLADDLVTPLVSECREISSMLEGLRKSLKGGGMLGLFFSWLF
ncbi:four helix bundle protein [Haloferula sp. A504]|uniref:four helix bundle protein n=1 Tax=Haloferula sp. A504 TaxID=3373601 RepID=UPI0031C6ED12|nr:four helix bundle protein [Verrucomicrobiaceae bacterium E54]